MSKSPATLYSLALYPMIQADICLKFHCSWSLVLIRMHRKNLPTSFKPAWMFKTSWEGHSPSASWACHEQQPWRKAVLLSLVSWNCSSLCCQKWYCVGTFGGFEFDWLKKSFDHFKNSEWAVNLVKEKNYDSQDMVIPGNGMRWGFW